MRLNTLLRPTLLLLLAALPAAAAGLDLPVWTPGSTLAPPYYRGDVLELRLAPSAARSVVPRGAAPTRPRPTGRLGVDAVDAVAAEVGVIAFTPEFVGETVPESPEETDFTAFHVAHLAEGSDLVTALERLRALPEVLSADPVAVLPVSASLPDDSLAFATYWLSNVRNPGHDIQAPEAWAVEDGDTSIVVGILDTGVLANHPDLSGRAGERGNLWVNWAERAGLPGVDDDGNGFVDDFAGWDFVATATQAWLGEDSRNADNDPNDWGGHGTAVAGVIGAIGGNGIGLAGVVPKVRLMPLRMGWLSQSNPYPPAGVVDMSYAAAALRYATRMGCAVVNCSWQSQNTGGLDAAVTAAVRAGMTVVNAAGNFGTGFTYLGQRSDVVSVAGVDSLDVVWTGSVVGSWVDLSAAASGMPTTIRDTGNPAVYDTLGGRIPGYKVVQGTSFASPQVAGVAALLQAQRRAQGRDPLTPASVLLRLRETTDDIRAFNLPTATGYGTGRLNASRALTDRPTSFALRTGSRSVGPVVVLNYNDGRSPLVVMAMSDRTLLAVDGATLDTVWTRTLPGVPTGRLAAADLGALGVRIVGATTTGQAFHYDDAGNVPSGWPVTVQNGLNLLSSAALADIDADGLAETIVAGAGVSGARVWALDAQGRTLAGFPFDAGTAVSLPALADLDAQRPGVEIAFTDGAGALRVVDRLGQELPGFPAGSAASARAPVVASGDTLPPLVIVAAGTTLTAWNVDGASAWTATLPAAAVQDPVLADLDGDGVDEVLVATAAPGLSAVRLDGSAMPAGSGWPLTLPAAASGPLVAGPFTADASVSVGVPQTATGFLAYDRIGRALGAFPKPGVAGQSPALADLDGDGATEVLAGAALADSNAYFYDAGAGTWSTSRAVWATTRGDEGRTASHARGAVGPLVLDRVRPARVLDLEAVALSNTSARLTWTTPGDDSLTGDAARVEVRRLLLPIDESNFATATLEVDRAPRATGERDTLVVSSLPEGTTWWFALRVGDSSGNLSAVSSADTVALPSLSPAAVADLRVLSVAESSVVLTWTASGEDGDVGRPVAYRIAGATFAITDLESFEAAPLHWRHLATVDAGAAETLLVAGLQPGRRWRFAVQAEDGSLLLGALSNVPEAVTPVGGALGGRAGRLALAPRPMPAVSSVTVDWQGDPSGVVESEVQVIDLNGRVLRREALGHEPGGSWTWDGRDGAMRPVPAGVYFLRLVSGARHATSRVVFIR